MKVEDTIDGMSDLYDIQHRRRIVEGRSRGVVNDLSAILWVFKLYALTMLLESEVVSYLYKQTQAFCQLR